jgi:hypothetical protein
VGAATVAVPLVTVAVSTLAPLARMVTVPVGGTLPVRVTKMPRVVVSPATRGLGETERAVLVESWAASMVTVTGEDVEAR